MSLALNPTTFMQPAKTSFHAVVPYTNLARAGWLQLCRPFHSSRLCPMRMNISASVQFGPRTLWDNVASDCDETEVDLPEFDLPLGRRPPREGTGAKEAGTWSSRNSASRSQSRLMGTPLAGHCELSPKCTVSSIA